MMWQADDYKAAFLNTWSTEQAWHYAITDARRITNQDYGQGLPISVYLGYPGEIAGLLLISYDEETEPIAYTIPEGIVPSGEVENCTLALLYIDPDFIKQSPLTLVQYGRAWEEWNGPFAHRASAMFIRATPEDAMTFLNETGTLENTIAARCDPTWTVQSVLDFVAASDLAGMPYRMYLKTEHWQAIRRSAIERAHGRCQLCNSKKQPFHVHHRTYERRGFEQPEDVIALCAHCHAKFHDKLPRGDGA